MVRGIVTRFLFLGCIALSICLLDYKVLSMEPNLIPEPPIENPPDRRDAPPLPMAPVIKSNKRFFRPAPRVFVQADRGLPPLPSPPANSWPADVRQKLGNDVTAEDYDIKKRTEVVRVPTSLQFDVEESPRISREDAQRNSSYTLEGSLLNKALKYEATESEDEQKETVDAQTTSDNDAKALQQEAGKKKKIIL